MESATSLRDVDDSNYTNMTTEDTINSEVSDSHVIIYIIIGKNFFPFE